MVRYASSSGNWRLALSLIEEMQKARKMCRIFTCHAKIGS